MKTETKILGIILILTAVVLFGGIFLLSRSSPKNSTETSTLQIDYTKGQKIGSDSAKVKLVEFSDFECPACAAVEPYLVKIRSGGSDVQFIYRHFPLPQHKWARPAANLAEIAEEKGKFWEMHDKIFETQSEWSKMTDATAFFLDLAKGLGLDENKVKQALEKNEFGSKIDADLAEGRRLGVNSTPSFFLNGRKLVLRSFEDLNIAIAEELKK